MKLKKSMAPGNLSKTSASNTSASQNVSLQLNTPACAPAPSTKCASAPVVKTAAARLTQQTRNVGFASPSLSDRTTPSLDNIPTTTGALLSSLQKSPDQTKVVNAKNKTNKPNQPSLLDTLMTPPPKSSFKTPSSSHHRSGSQSAAQNKGSGLKQSQQQKISPPSAVSLLGSITSTTGTNSLAQPSKHLDRYSPSLSDVMRSNNQAVTPLPSLFGHPTQQLLSPVKSSGSAHNSSAESDDIPLSTLASWLADRANQSQSSTQHEQQNTPGGRNPNYAARSSSQQSFNQSSTSQGAHANSVVPCSSMQALQAALKQAQSSSALQQGYASISNHAETQRQNAMTTALAHTSVGAAAPRRANTTNPKRRVVTTASNPMAPAGDSRLPSTQARSQQNKPKIVSISSGGKNIPLPSQSGADASGDDYNRMIMDYFRRNPSAAASFANPSSKPAPSTSVANAQLTPQHSPRNLVGSQAQSWSSPSDSTFQRPSCAFAGRSPMSSASPNFAPTSPTNHMRPPSSPRLTPSSPSTLPAGASFRIHRTCDTSL